MRTPLIDGKAPGQFRARCNLTVAKLDAKLTVDERHEAKDKGYRRSLDTTTRKPRWFVHFPQCGGFETTDRAAFVEHMRTVHGKSEFKGEAESWALGIRKMWRGPRLSTEGKPLTKAAAGVAQACGSCGLVAEVDDRPGNVLWWAEHERGCALAQAAS